EDRGEGKSQKSQRNEAPLPGPLLLLRRKRGRRPLRLSPNRMYNLVSLKIKMRPPCAFCLPALHGFHRSDTIIRCEKPSCVFQPAEGFVRAFCFYSSRRFPFWLRAATGSPASGRRTKACPT